MSARQQTLHSSVILRLSPSAKAVHEHSVAMAFLRRTWANAKFRGQTHSIALEIKLVDSYAPRKIRDRRP